MQDGRRHPCAVTIAVSGVPGVFAVVIGIEDAKDRVG